MIFINVLFGLLIVDEVNERTNKITEKNIQLLEEEAITMGIGRICYGICEYSTGSICFRCDSPISRCPRLVMEQSDAGMHSDCSVQPD